jgi:hypothetical protein
MEVLLFVLEINLTTQPSKYIRTAELPGKRVNHQGQRGRLAPALVSGRFVLGWREIWTLQVCPDVGFRRERR